MSTQYLFQPFVWANWPITDVLEGWIEVLRDRLVVAVTIALALAAASHITASRLAARASCIGLAIVVGAALGEFALLAMGSPLARGDLPAVLGGIIQWAGLAVFASGTFYLWRSHDEARAALRGQELLRSRAEAMAVSTRLQALRQQIEPHFLFNTLATIRHLREADPDDGCLLLQHLRQYLGSTMASSAPRSTLGDEVDLVQSYLAIVAIRMSGRLAVSFDIPASLRTYECPPLALATLVENAVKHGITPSATGGAIEVAAQRHAGALELTVADTGVGISGAGSACMGGSGIGLANTRATLRALYGDEATLMVTENAPGGVRAVLRIPLRSHRP
jgi:signal transduction histidine kinase